MNPDQPSREQIESRITALLLGELPADEAALLRYTIAQDPALQRLHDELQSTLVLVREAAKNPEEPAIQKAETLKLSAERRQILLAHFKTPRPKAAPEPLFWLKPIKMSPLIKVLAAVAIIAVLAAMFLPALSSAKRKSQRAVMLGVGRREELVARLQEAEHTPAPANALPAPAAPEPAVVPPPAQIVLPAAQPEPGQLADNNGLSVRGSVVGAQSMTSALRSPQEIASQIIAPKTAGVYSQNLVGYVAIPTNAVELPMIQSGDAATRLPATSPVAQPEGNFTFQAGTPVNLEPEKSAQKQWIVPGQETGAPTLAVDKDANRQQFGVGGFGGLGGGGGAAAGTAVQRQGEAKDFKRSGNYEGFFEPQPASSAVAPNDSGVDRSISAYSPQKVGLGTPEGAVERRIGIQSDLAKAMPLTLQPAPVAAVPPASLAGNAPTDLGGEVAMANPPATPVPGGVAGNAYYLAPAPAAPNKDVPLLGDVPLTGNLFQNQAAPIAKTPANPELPQVATAASAPISAGDTLGSGLVSRDQSVEVMKLANSSPEQASQVLQKMFPTSTQRNSSTSQNQSSALTTRQMNNAPAATVGPGGQTPTSNWNLGASLRGFYDELQTTNAIAMNGGAAARENPEISASTPTLDARQFRPLNEKKVDEVKKADLDAKRELEQKQATHKLFQAELQAEKVDLNLPKNSMVQVTDRAQPNAKQSFWQRLTGQYASAARIKVENDVTDIPGMASTPASVPYDPYFIQTTLEIMKSDLVLSNVVKALNLQSAWAKKNDGQPLTEHEAVSLLQNKLDLHPVPNTKLVEIGVTSDDPNEAANIANAVAQAYQEYRFEARRALTTNGLAVLEEQFQEQEHDLRTNQAYVEQLERELNVNGEKEATQPTPEKTDVPIRKPAPNAPIPQPEILTSSNAFSTFSLNVSDVSFKFAEASLQNNKLPDTASIRSEEFINAFDYRDPEAAEGQPMAFASERARYPFAHNRELLRFAIKTAAAGRQQGRALNLVLMLDVSGSMERADRVAIIHEALRVLATQLQPQDTVSVVTFARTARLWADGISGDKAGDTLGQVGGITPEGGTNLEEAMRLAYETAHRHYLANGQNRVVLLTDGAANLGSVEPETLKQKVEAQRKQGIALDCFGIGWEDYNDDLLELLSSNGDGRYAFLNSPADAAKDFAAKLAGALQIAAADVKVQVEFNPARVISYRQIGYATHQLTKEQFRDNTVAAGEIAAQEAGNALYAIETSPGGEGPIATVHVRYRIPGTTDYREHSWDVAYTGNAPALEQSSPAMRLAATASAFSEWLAASPYAQEVTLDELLKILSGVPEVYGADDRPKQLETMIREAKSANYEPKMDRTNQSEF